MKHKYMKNIIYHATREAQLSSGVGRLKNNRLGAILLDKKGIMRAQGHNSYKTHPAVRHYEYPCLHAEAHAMINHGLNNCKGCDIVVVRILKDDSLTMAKPCTECVRFMRSYGINDIYYTDWNGQVQQMGP